MVRYIKEAQVRQILTMHEALQLMEQLFHDRAQGKAFDIPRRRLRQPGGALSILQGAAPRLNTIGYKVTYARPTAHNGFVHLYDQERGNLVAIIECEWMGIMRTGASRAVAY